MKALYETKTLDLLVVPVWKHVDVVVFSRVRAVITQTWATDVFHNLMEIIVFTLGRNSTMTLQVDANIDVYQLRNV